MKLTHKQRKAAMTILKLSQTICSDSELKSNIQLQLKLKYTDIVNENDWKLVNKLIVKLN